MTQDQADKEIESISIHYRYRWCEPGKGFSEEQIKKKPLLAACACLGCANYAGQLGSKITKEQWQNWVIRHPRKTE